MKLNVLLAKTDSLAIQYKNMLKDYLKFFKQNQESFRGVQLTYQPNEDSVDEPKRRGVKKVVTTVDEKLGYLSESAKEYIDALFSQEATNASGSAKAELVVDGESWGEFSSLELLRLKSLVESGDFKNLYATIPVRSDDRQWEQCDNEMYAERNGIFQSPLLSYENKTTIKESYILKDPNVSEKTPDYVPQVATRNITQVLGKGTQQEFTGEWSHRQRAIVQRKISTLHTAIVEALKVANECETVKSGITAEKIFGYLHS